MDLKKFLPGQKDEHEGEYFWSLLIEPGWVQAGAWHVVSKMSHVVSSSPAIAWELSKELIDASDSALSSAVSGLPSETEDPTKTVFGVVGSWVVDGTISPDHLSKIKHVCTDLGLTPIGFVVLPEAIAHFLKYQEQTPLSAILLGHYKESIEISVFRLGNLIGTTHVSRSVSLADDVVEGLSRFSTPEGVPSRFILYNGKESELEEARQELLAVDWSKINSLKFIHHPKIEIFSLDKKIEAVSFAGGTEVAGVEGIAQLDSGTSEDQSLPIVNAGGQEISVKPIGEDISQPLPSDFGFTTEITSDEEMNIHKNISPVDDEDNALGGELTKIKNEIYDDVKTNSNLHSHAHMNHHPEMSTTSEIKTSKKEIKLPSFPTPPPILSNAFTAIKMPLLIGITALVAIFVGGFTAWWYYPSAEVVVYVSPRELDEKVQVTISSQNGSSDQGTNVISGNLVKTEVSGTKTKETTGTKTVGEKAKGEVTLYRVGSELTLKSGTSLTGPGGLKFVLDNETVVASGSASSPSETKAAVSSAQIGADYNLASGASFSVSNYTSSDIEAKNESAFYGGTSREVASVTASDQKDLTKDLTEELIAIARSELEQQLSVNEIFIDSSIDSVVDNNRFTADVGAEAESVELSLELSVNAITVDKSKMSEIARAAVESKVPEGFVLRDDQIELSFDLAKSEDDKYIFDVTIVANLLPQVSPTIIAEKMRGKYPSVAEETLQSEVPGFVRAEIKSKPKLPGRLGTLPQVTKNIDVQIAAER